MTLKRNQYRSVSKVIRAPIVLTFLAVAACSESNDIGPPPKSQQTTVTGKISLKSLSTGLIASDELRAAKSEPLTWTYFGKPRIIEYDELLDNTVVEIKFSLEDSWEGYKLREELETKFKKDGSANFKFHCVSTGGSVDFSDKRFKITDENCYAFDDKQTLVISRRWPQYEEPLVKQFPSLKLLIDHGSVTLYDQSLRKAKSDEEINSLLKQIENQDDNAKKDM